MKKILITGGAWFIGSHIVDACIARWDEVLVIDNLITGSRNNLADVIDTGKIRFLETDICDANTVQRAFLDFQPEVVFHLAAQINVRKWIENPAFDIGNNIQGSVAIFEAMREVGCKRIIFSSTGWALFSHGDIPYNEGEYPSPNTPYGISKWTVEQLLHFYEQHYGFQPTILRYANVYGPRQNPHGEAGVISIFLEKMRNHKPITILWDGEQTRDFIHVSDVVNANLHVLRKNILGTYHVGTGKETSINQLYRQLQTSSWYTLPPQYIPSVGEIMRSALDSSRLQQTDWSPSLSLQQGIDTLQSIYTD